MKLAKLHRTSSVKFSTLIKGWVQGTQPEIKVENFTRGFYVTWQVSEAIIAIIT